MKVAIYCRVSDVKKKPDGERRQDINRQVELITEFLERKGINSYELYLDDGISAYTEDWNSRPAFKKLINDCRLYYVKEIYIEDMTRFSRNLVTGLKLMQELGELGVNLISLKEGEFEVTQSQDWMKSAMLLMFSEYTSRIQAEKVKSGMARAKDKGKHTGRPRKEVKDG